MERDYNPISVPLKELKGKCGVYQLRNTVTGGLYVGSSKTLKERLKTHLSALRRGKHENPYLQHAWDKYEGNFVAEIIEFCNEDEQYSVEQYWINKFFGENCYNINPSAVKPPDCTGKTLPPKSEETRKKLSASKKKLFQEHPELRVQMSLSRIGKRMGAEHVNSKDVVCLETGELFHGISEAGRKMNIYHKLISQCCTGANKTAEGLHFRYKEDYDKLTQEEIDEIILVENRSIQVVCLETREVFNKIIDADAAHPGANRKSITLCCRKELPTAGGLHWVYYEEYKNMTEEEIADILKWKSKSNLRRCKCLETGQIFETLSEAERVLNLPKGKVGMVCTGHRKHTGGYHFKYID